MPCTKCKDEKYKWGKTGECKYANKEQCEKANPKNYNQMKSYPTPLGKKTYEEYEKELKEFNLSKVEKVEFNATAEMKKLSSEVSKLAQSANKLWIKVSEDTASQYLDLQDIWDTWRETSKKASSYTSTANKLEKANDDTNTVVKTLEGKLTKLIGHIREVQNFTKELGIDRKSVPGYSDAVDVGDSTVGIINKIDNDKTTTKSIKAMREMIKDITA